MKKVNQTRNLTYLNIRNLLLSLFNFSPDWLKFFLSEHDLKVLKLLPVKLLIKLLLDPSVVFLLLQGGHPQIQLGVFRDNLVAEAFEFLKDDLIALFVDLRLNLVQVLKEGLLTVNYRVFRRLGLHLPLELFDLFGEVRAELLDVIDFLD